MDARSASGRGQCCAAHPREDVVASLLRAYLFATLSPADLVNASARAAVRHYERDDVVFAVGDAAECLFVVVDGQLKERFIQPEGDETVFELFTSGAVFGEPALFVKERTRMVDVVAVVRSHVLCLPRDSLLDLLRRCPDVTSRLIEGLANEIRGLSIQLGNASHLSVKERVASKLLELSRTHGRHVDGYERIELILPQSLLASMVAATRENVNRALADLSAAGAVAVDRGRYLVDPRLLDSAAHTYSPLPRRNGQRQDVGEAVT